ncbi:MAG: hypothetical protein U0984_12665 [Prosthecobacter sp.]|nr:hypothetical protein [Prosthecobacter sp.]
MSTVTEIESAIREMPRYEFWKLAHWFDEVRADAKAGRLDHPWEQAKQEIATGEAVTLEGGAAICASLC